MNLKEWRAKRQHLSGGIAWDKADDSPGKFSVEQVIELEGLGAAGDVLAQQQLDEVARAEGAPDWANYAREIDRVMTVLRQSTQSIQDSARTVIRSPMMEELKAIYSTSEGQRLLVRLQQREIRNDSVLRTLAEFGAEFAPVPYLIERIREHDRQPVEIPAEEPTGPAMTTIQNDALAQFLSRIETARLQYGLTFTIERIAPDRTSLRGKISLVDSSKPSLQDQYVWADRKSSMRPPKLDSHNTPSASKYRLVTLIHIGDILAESVNGRWILNCHVASDNDYHQTLLRAFLNHLQIAGKDPGDEYAKVMESNTLKPKPADDPCAKLPKTAVARKRWKEAYAIVRRTQKEYARKYGEGDTDSPTPRLEELRDALKEKGYKMSPRRIQDLKKAGDRGCLKE